jgi:hypothetical protein
MFSPAVGRARYSATNRCRARVLPPSGLWGRATELRSTRNILFQDGMLATGIRALKNYLSWTFTDDSRVFTVGSERRNGCNLFSINQVTEVETGAVFRLLRFVSARSEFRVV